MPSTNPDLQALSARLDKLETQARRWKLASIVLALSSASLILTITGEATSGQLGANANWRFDVPVTTSVKP